MAETEQLSAWEESLPAAQPAQGAPGPAGKPARGRAAQKQQQPKPETLAFPNLLAFVEFLFARKLVVRRPGGAVAWCPKWYLHAEVISRLTVLWDEFEKAKKNKNMSDWWLHHLDPHLAVITNPNSGPFMACRPTEHRDLEALPIGDPDPRLFQGSVFADPAAARPKRSVAAAKKTAAPPDAAAS